LQKNLALQEFRLTIDGNNPECLQIAQLYGCDSIKAARGCIRDVMWVERVQNPHCSPTATVTDNNAIEANI